MALSRRVSLQKGAPTAANTPPATPRNARQARRRSASPTDKPTPIIVRDEPPARSTRSWVSAPSISNIMPTAEQRIPVDCPFIRCRASTVHQHLPQLQYYNPRLDRAVRSRGYGNSSSGASSRPRLRVAPRRVRQDRGTSLGGPEVAGRSEVVETVQEVEGQVIVRGDEEDLIQEQPARDPGQHTAPDGPSAEETNEVQEPAPTPNISTVDDVIHHERKSTLHHAPVTPPASSPIAADEDSSVQNLQISPEKQQQPAPSAPPQIKSGDYLPNHNPNAPPSSPSSSSSSSSSSNNPPQHTHIHTYDELIRPLVDPTLPPAPGMKEITRILLEFRSPWDRSDGVGGDEVGYMREFELEKGEGEGEGGDEWGRERGQ